MELAYVIPPVCIHVVRWCAVLPRFCRVTSGTLPVAALQRRPVDANKGKIRTTVANVKPEPADNLDYNSLKHEIKVHTTRDQASAMAIPGHQDTALRKFEDGLFDELGMQHDRVDMFVTSKADEISRRLGTSVAIDPRIKSRG